MGYISTITVAVIDKIHNNFEYPHSFTAVPQILKDALHVTSQNTEAEMAKTLRLAFQYTGES